MPPPRSLSQQFADVALGLLAGAVRIWRAGAGPEPDARPRHEDCPRVPRRHYNHGTWLSADDLRAYLNRLYLERLEAHTTRRLDAVTADLDAEIDDCRAALLGAMVIDIARQRAEGVGRQTG